ncbi:protein of unknown function [Acetoanaerobium sticklandii]|uniref:Uncharacterized protein n=1 Tax=Acetoanaerobium sticklandii (strain ATCC 12662 / DSM 519 / JCM 1433 / CCUG 9281 / NCIMB 10654 / HF) TaxID=499177 RepID=E3PUZ6_ACESD|nr:protein of unknown function [Acetoanaerobium sticklandii]
MLLSIYMMIEKEIDRLKFIALIMTEDYEILLKMLDKLKIVADG